MYISKSERGVNSPGSVHKQNTWFSAKVSCPWTWKGKSVTRKCILYFLLSFKLWFATNIAAFRIQDDTSSTNIISWLQTVGKYALFIFRITGYFTPTEQTLQEESLKLVAQCRERCHKFCRNVLTDRPIARWIFAALRVLNRDNRNPSVLSFLHLHHNETFRVFERRRIPRLWTGFDFPYHPGGTVQRPILTPFYIFLDGRSEVRIVPTPLVVVSQTSRTLY